MSQRSTREGKQGQGSRRATGDAMEFPIRCFSCGKVVGHLWEKYKELVASGVEPKEAFAKLGVERYCCRRMFVGHVELNEEVLPYIRE